MSSLLWRLFSFKGRINRASFAIVFLAMWVVHFAIQRYALTHYIDVAMLKAKRPDLAFHAPPLGLALAFIPFSIGLAWIGLANQVKRLHDFGWSGWWIMMPTAILVVLVILAVSSASGHALTTSLMLILAAALFALSTLFLTGMMFFRAGDDGENGHPRGPQGDDRGPSNLEGLLARELAARSANPARQAHAAQIAPAPAASASVAPIRAKDDSLLPVYRPPQRQPTTFGRRTG